MGFLLRMTFWFSLVLLALPLDTGKRGEGEQPVGPFQALMAAREAVTDVAGICERKPGVCETGQAAIQTIAGRAREGVRLVMGEDGPDNAAATGSVTAAVPAEPVGSF